MLILTDDEVLARGLELVGFDEVKQAKAGEISNVLLFKEHYGSMPIVYAQLWEDLQLTDDATARVNDAKEKDFDYFMAAVHFLKAYPTEGQRAGIFKRCKRNCRDWGWTYVKKISLLKPAKIVWPAEWVPENPELPYFLISVDGTHCPYHEVKHPVLPYDPQMYSHKTNQPALAYEVALSLHESKVVSVRGPFKASVHDKTIFNSYLRDLIPQGCMGIADRGYRGAHNLSTPNDFDTPELKEYKERARARQESLFRRVKTFSAVRDQYRHKVIEKHQWTFEAVCVIVQYQFENGSPLFEIEP
jgi:DDE superfamily endonuclease